MFFLFRLVILLLSLSLISCATSEALYVGAPLAESVRKARLMWPVAGTITSYYGPRGGRLHHGIDIGAPRGARIYSAARGQVEFSGYQNGYGWTVIVNHKTFKALYAHCERLKVKKGQWVRQGQTIATVGSSGRSTGYHLHFELRDQRNKSFDPILYMPL